MRDPAIITTFRTCRRDLVASTASCARSIPKPLPIIWHRRTSQASVKRLGLEADSKYKAAAFSPLLQPGNPNEAPMPYLFHFAVSRVAPVKDAVHAAAFNLSTARQTNSSNAVIRDAYTQYAEAARALMWGHPHRMEDLQNCMRFVGPAMDMMDASDDPEDKAALEIMRLDFDNMWWSAVIWHLEHGNQGAEMNWMGEKNWYPFVELLGRHKKREKAVQYLLRLESIRMNNRRQPTQQIVDFDLRPAWRGVLNSYTAESDFAGVANLLRASLACSRAIRSTLLHEVLTWLCSLDPRPPESEFAKYMDPLSQAMQDGNMTDFTVLLRCFLRLGKMEEADRQATELWSVHRAKLNGAARDALLEYAIVRKDLSSAWVHLEAMVADNQVPLRRNLKALLELEKTVSVEDRDEERRTQPERATMKAIYRALAEEGEDGVEKALSTYYAAKESLGARPDVRFVLPIVDALCSKESLQKGGFARALKLFQEVCDEYPDESRTGDRAKGGPNKHLCTILLEVLVGKPNLADVGTIVTQMYHRGIAPRTSLVNELCASCIVQAKDHQEAFEYLRFIYFAFPRQINWVDNYRLFIDTPHEGSICPPSDLALALIPKADMVTPGFMQQPGKRIVTLLKRYALIVRILNRPGNTNSDERKEQMVVLLTNVRRIHEMLLQVEQTEGGILNEWSWTPQNYRDDWRHLMHSLMDVYNGLGLPEETLKIWEQLWETRNMESGTIARPMRAFQMMGNWQEAVRTWTMIRSEPLSAFNPPLQLVKVTWDSYLSRLLESSFVLRTAAHMVREAQSEKHLFAAVRGMYLEHDVSTALHLLEWVENVAGEKGREIAEQDFGEFLGVVYDKLVSRGKIKNAERLKKIIVPERANWSPGNPRHKTKKERQLARPEAWGARAEKVLEEKIDGADGQRAPDVMKELIDDAANSP